MRKHKPWCEEAANDRDGLWPICTCERREGERRKRIDLMGALVAAIQRESVKRGPDRRTDHPIGSEDHA